MNLFDGDSRDSSTLYISSTLQYNTFEHVFAFQFQENFIILYIIICKIIFVFYYFRIILCIQVCNRYTYTYIRCISTCMYMYALYAACIYFQILDIHLSVFFTFTPFAPRIRTSYFLKLRYVRITFTLSIMPVLQPILA